MDYTTLKIIWKLVKETVTHFAEDNATRLGAALSFYTIVSLPPILMMVITSVGFFYGEQAVKGELSHQISEVVGKQAAQFIQTVAENATLKKGGFGLTILGIVAAVFSATGVFVQLQEAFNTIWKVRAKSGTGNAILNFLRMRLVSLIFIFNIGLLIVSGFFASTLLAIFGEYLSTYLSTFSVYILRFTNFVISYGLFVLVFAALFKFIPDVKLKWEHVWVGAIVTTILFGIGRYIIGMYLTKSDVTSAYGVAGSFVMLLLWIFYTSQILFFGAAFTKVWNEHKGNKIKPRKYAVKVHVKEVF